METAVIVKVAVSAAPYSIDKPYDYLVPESLLDAAVPGVRVTVPFGRGNRESEGMILAQGTGEKVKGLKPLMNILDREPVLDQDGIALALWMRQRYFCTMFEAVKAILPAGLWYRFRETWFLTDDPEGREKAQSVKGGGPVWETLAANGGQCELETLRSLCGEQVQTVLKSLRKAGLVRCETAAKRRISDKTRRMAELAVSAEDALALTEARRRSAPMRYEVVRLLASTGKASAADICYFTGASMQTLRGLEKSGILTFSEEEELRVPEAKQIEPGLPIILNSEQQAAFEAVMELVAHPNGEVALLHGVTGSGKTQVYLRLVQEICSREKPPSF